MVWVEIKIFSTQVPINLFKGDFMNKVLTIALCLLMSAQAAFGCCGNNTSCSCCTTCCTQECDSSCDCNTTEATIPTQADSVEIETKKVEEKAKYTCDSKEAVKPVPASTAAKDVTEETKTEEKTDIVR